MTNRSLCVDTFLKRIEDIAIEKPGAIILREKDLPEDSYAILAKQVMQLCAQYEVVCMLHTYVKTAISLQATGIHLPLPQLRIMTDEEKSHFTHIGTSCHSLQDAVEAEKLGCTYVIAGHIYETACKKDLSPRGIGFLSEICQKICIPVYAIGGINANNYPEVLGAGAAGGCVMSGVMQCEDVHAYMEEFGK